ncbi:MAG: TIM barrel protein [Opitutae bacterium]|nr:TIM barrel protein [Opitutae bacterium]
MSYLRCISSLGFPEATLDELLALALRHRLDAVELRALETTVDLPQLFTHQHGTPAALAAKLRHAALPVWALGTSLRLLDGAEADFEKMLAWVPWAEALGVRWLRVFDGGKTGDAAELAHGAALAQRWQALRRQHGWQVDWMVETHDALVTTPALQRFLTAVPDAWILWDTHHTWKKGGEDPVATWRVLRERIVHVHVKDSISQPSARHPFTYVLPGTGEFPMAPLVAVLQAEHRGAVSLEWEKMWHPYLPPLDDALRVAAAKNWW